MTFRWRLAFFVGLLLGVWTLIVPLAVSLGGTDGFLAATAAMLTCLVSGVLVLVVSEQLRGPEWILQQVGLAMFLRTGLPLLVCMGVYLHGGRLAKAGLVYYLFAFYIVALMAETLLAVRGLGQQKPKVS